MGEDRGNGMSYVNVGLHKLNTLGAEELNRVNLPLSGDHASFRDNRSGNAQADWGIGAAVAHTVFLAYPSATLQETHSRHIWLRQSHSLSFSSFELLSLLSSFPEGSRVYEDKNGHARGRGKEGKEVYEVYIIYIDTILYTLTLAYFRLSSYPFFPH